MLCVIWYHLYNLKNLKSTHGGVLFSVKLQAEACNFTKSISSPWVFFLFSNCTNGTKLRNASYFIYIYIYIYIVVRYSQVGIYFVQSQQWKHENNGISSKLIMTIPERLQWRFIC